MKLGNLARWGNKGKISESKDLIPDEWLESATKKWKLSSSKKVKKVIHDNENQDQEVKPSVYQKLYSSSIIKKLDYESVATLAETGN